VGLGFSQYALKIGCDVVVQTMGTKERYG
jgi:hypothetical protein